MTAKTNKTLSTLLGFLLLIAISGCEKENVMEPEQDISERFFAYDEQVKLIEDVIIFLKNKNDSVQFINEFAENYGYPKWSKLINIYESEFNRSLIFIPIVNTQYTEIETIWVFKIINGYIEYYPVDKASVKNEDLWSFDYFTQEVLKKRPVSGSRFETEAELSTRAWTEKYHCTQGFAGFEINGEYLEVSTGWHCWSSMQYLMANYDDFSGGGGGGSGSFAPSPGGGGGGGGGYSPPPATQLNSNLKTLFKGKNNLSNEDTKKLNKAYEEMRQNCFYEFIDNYLMRNNVQLNNINIDPSYSGQAGVSSTGNLTFWNSDEINSHNLSHEWIHLFQRQYNSMSSFGDKRGMMEFELALTQDILNFIETGDFAKFSSWSNQSNLSIKEQEDYQKWVKMLTLNGTHYPSTIDNIRYQELSKIFGEYSIGYNANRGYIYGTNIYKSTAIQSLFNQAKLHCK